MVAQTQSTVKPIYLKPDGSVELYGYFKKKIGNEPEEQIHQKRATLFPDRIGVERYVNEYNVVWREEPLEPTWDGQPTVDLYPKISADFIKSRERTIVLYLDNTVPKDLPEDGTKSFPFHSIGALYRLWVLYHNSLGCKKIHVYCNGVWSAEDFSYNYHGNISYYDVRGQVILDGLVYDNVKSTKDAILPFVIHNSRFFGDNDHYPAKQRIFFRYDVYNSYIEFVNASLNPAATFINCNFLNCEISSGVFYECRAHDLIARPVYNDYPLKGYKSQLSFVELKGYENWFHCTDCEIEIRYKTYTSDNYGGYYNSDNYYVIPHIKGTNYLSNHDELYGRIDNCTLLIAPDVTEVNFEWGKRNVDKNRVINGVVYDWSGSTREEDEREIIQWTNSQINLDVFDSFVKVLSPKVGTLPAGEDMYVCGKTSDGKSFWTPARTGVALGQELHWGNARYRKNSTFEIHFALPPCSDGGNGGITFYDNGKAYGRLGGNGGGSEYIGRGYNHYSINGPYIGKGGSGWDEVHQKRVQARDGWRVDLTLDGIKIAPTEKSDVSRKFYSILPNPETGLQVQPHNCTVIYDWEYGSATKTFNPPAMQNSLPEDLQ